MGQISAIAAFCLHTAEHAVTGTVEHALASLLFYCSQPVKPVPRAMLMQGLDEATVEGILDEIDRAVARVTKVTGIVGRSDDLTIGCRSAILADF
jgi:hypothetical protein